MKLRFYGADRCVTGSCHCLEVNGKKILVDCGLQQGRDEVDNASLPFHPGAIDCVLVTHAHIDHSGRLPLLIKNGFEGKIITTRLTAQLLSIMLQDSAHIQESDAEYQNRKNLRAGRPTVQPLYTVEDAERVKEFVQTCEYGETVQLCEGVTAEFIDAGHLLGSASIRVTAHEGGETRVIVFSGDIGNVDQPIIRDPQFFDSADYVLMESTYGNRNHTEVWSYTDDLAQIIDETLGRTLLDGAASVKLFGEDVAVRAKIVNFQGLSSHADRDHLLAWIARYKAPKPQHVFIVHGDREVAPLFAETISAMGFNAHAPQYTEEYDLITCTQLAKGFLPERKKMVFDGQGSRAGVVYQKLLQALDALQALVRRSKGRDNKTLGAMAEAIRKITEKYEF